MANCEDPDQLASSEASWSESTQFAKVGYIRVQQDKGWDGIPVTWETNLFSESDLPLQREAKLPTWYFNCALPLRWTIFS